MRSARHRRARRGLGAGLVPYNVRHEPGVRAIGTPRLDIQAEQGDCNAVVTLRTIRARRTWHVRHVTHPLCGRCYQ